MNNSDQFQTDFLFSNSSYLSGASNIFNLGGNFYEYNSSESEELADSKAIGNDFNIIGNDLTSAMLTVMEK